MQKQRKQETTTTTYLNFKVLQDARNLVAQAIPTLQQQPASWSSMCVCHRRDSLLSASVRQLLMLTPVFVSLPHGFCLVLLSASSFPLDLSF